MPEVLIYTTRSCGYCLLAKRLLNNKGVSYREIDVTGDREKRAWLRQASGQRTVPQVFIDERPFGGFTDIEALDRRGELDRLLFGQ